MSKIKKIISILQKRKMKMAFAESCTGGLLSAAVTSVIASDFM